ncbi:MAG: tRNA (adenosine(37)-N6)-threonylcarbamoyltransferase complex ATPase subunit type 1 TsaE [Elainellaceae cyanobacterium]
MSSLPWTHTIDLPDATATQRLGELLGRSLPAGSILLLEGDLGAGKTTLVQGIGQGLGVADPIVSPTFTLINEYSDGRVPLYHMDLYRLEPAEAEALYLEQYWNGQELPLGIVAIEWADRLAVAPTPNLHLALQTYASAKRRVHLTPAGEFDWTDYLENLPGQFAGVISPDSMTNG